MNSLFSLEHILAATSGLLLVSGPTQFNGVSTDTRTLQAGDLYVALHGERMNGHTFLTLAREKGAAGAIIDEAVPGIRPRHTTPGEWSVIEVTDTLYALGQLSAFHRRRFGAVPIIGITGSAGKTTTKEMTAAILEGVGAVLRSPGNFNNEIGMPLTLLALTRAHQSAVLEFGMRGRGQIGYLAALARPSIGVITNVGLTHLELLGTQQEIALAKAELLDEMSSNSTAILPHNDEFSPLLREHAPGTVLTFGDSGDADFRASDIMLGDDGCARFQLHYHLQTLPIVLGAPGRHQIMNALAAAAAAMTAGAGEEAVVRGLAGYAPEKGRMRSLRAPRGYTVIDDTYNANPAAVRATLEFIAELPGARKIAILGDMRELGAAARAIHQDIGRYAIEVGVDALLAVGELGQEYIAGAADSRAQWYPDNATLAQAIFPELRAGDVVLVKGSRAMNMEEVVESLLAE